MCVTLMGFHDIAFENDRAQEGMSEEDIDHLLDQLSHVLKVWRVYSRRKERTCGT